MGRGAHLQHDRHAARLVHLAPARLGRADHRLLLRRLPRAAHRSQDPGPHRRRCSREHTADIWYERTRRGAAAGRARRAPSAAAANSRKENDILDVWFDSGSSHLAVLNDAIRPALAGRPVPGRRRSVSRLVPQLAAGGHGPARAARRTATCALNGWVLDGEGKAMHKSLGNAIEPEEVIKNHGAEMLRLWSASVEFNEDVRMSETILTRLTEAYRKLRNTFRYMLGNLSDFDPATRRGAGRRAARRSTSGSCCAPRTWWRAAAAGTTSSSSTRSITRSTISRRWTSARSTSTC